MKHLNNATTWALSVFDSDMSATQKLICLYLRTHMNDYRDMAWPSVARIAAKCGVSTRTVQREMPKICSRGYLGKNGHSIHGTVRYEIHTPELDAPPRHDVTPTQCRNTPDTVSPELTKELTNRESIGIKRFKPPDITDLIAYSTEKEYTDFDYETFFDFYESKGWMVGRNKMKDWKAAVRNWNKRKGNENTRQATGRQNSGRLSGAAKTRAAREDARRRNSGKP